MDNIQIDITAEGAKSLKAALSIAFEHNASGKTVKSYEIKTFRSKPYGGVPEDLVGKKGLVFRWLEKNASRQDEAVDLPFKLDLDGATDFATRWLAEQDFGPEPGHDGSNGKGWRIYTGMWGHVDEDRYAICAIFPEWAWYGK